MLSSLFSSSHRVLKGTKEEKRRARAPIKATIQKVSILTFPKRKLGNTKMEIATPINVKQAIIIVAIITANNYCHLAS